MLYKAGLQRLFLAQLCCPNLPTFHCCLSVCHLVVPKRGLEWVVVAGQAYGQTTHSCTHTEYTLIRAEKTNQCSEICSNSCLSDWLSLRQCCTFNKWLFLCICTVAQKDNSSVCAWGDYSIPLLFLLHSHTNPGLLTLQSSEITQTCKKHKVATHREHGKVSDHFQEWREEFKQLDRKAQWDIKKKNTPEESLETTIA